ncbi:hypothetical protein ACIQUM_07945 [Amycolatopsis azurea]|uniref:hypothetical protein n=1 Tax=Amycolatopsis azurea TaxID=36819 RepID=UPI0038245E5C
MGFDWEGVLGTSGAGLDDAYDAAVSAAIYPGPRVSEAARLLSVGAEYDEIDSRHR